MTAHLNDPAPLLAGRWHLIAAECADGQIPSHRVDLVFHDDDAGLRGAILSRNSGSEMPLPFVAFSGTELRLTMSGPAGRPVAPTFLVMTAVADRFEGAWDRPGMEHMRLKMVRAQE